MSLLKNIVAKTELIFTRTGG